MAKATPRGGLGLITTVVLYVLASPIYALRAIVRAIATWRARGVIRTGFLKCPACRHGNRLDVLATCRAKDCGWVEHRSLALPCSRCGRKQPWLACAKCGASIDLP